MGIQLSSQHTERRRDMVCLKIPRKPKIDHSNQILVLFLTKFVAENDFTGNPSTWFVDIQTHFATDKAVHHAIKALSALYACQKDSSTHAQDRRLALEFYQTAVLSVKQAVNAKNAKIEQPLLSSTFLLGLFELMYDPTGQGWIKHTMYGTSKILQHLGPEVFQSGLGLSFFNQMKMFEVSRSLIFSESSFLVEKSWLGLTHTFNMQDSNTHPIEELLNLMVRCSDHCARALTYLESLDKYTISDSNIRHLRKFALEGFKLRFALSTLESHLSSLPPHLLHDNRITIAKIYFSATSIFLSGVYDYRSLWLQTIEATPTLSQALIECHVTIILNMTEFAMQQTNLSKLLFLYPLRVACARVWREEQKDRLRGLFEVIRRSFAVVDVFRSEVEELWRTPLAERYT
ncbi:hypothetical protein QM012_005444 [Aureobasidium pullulans]|uniref:C6 transcription factor n=1 Tax=Aureobasidium pullulans TaxID=5580 RepID=A0ABR0T4N9_AURPU